MSDVDDKPKQEKPRGKCTGCAFEYQLGTARSGEFKGQPVIRKHNSRTGPGLCSGAQRPPTVEHAEGCGEDHRFGPSVCAGCAVAEATELPHDTQPAGSPVFPALHATTGTCGHAIAAGDRVRSSTDDIGGVRCAACPQPTVPLVELRIPAADPWTAPGPVPAIDTESAAGEPCGESAANMAAPVTIAEVHAENPPRSKDVQSYATRIEQAPAMPPLSTEPDPWTAPGPMSDIPEKTVTVSGQPDPDRDRWGRYMILGQAHTRATTFAKLGANTKAIEAWNERNVIVGLTKRDDLLMMADGKEVKRDKKELNEIAEQAKAAAGNKVAANIGTGYHSFTERIDAGLMTVDQVPERYRARVQQYIDVTRRAGIQFRPEWIERTTGVRADQVSAPLPVGGMLDRIGQLPDGSLVIVDLKTGADLSYGEMEIEVQLALYAHGVNTHGLFDWNTKTWQPLTQSVDRPAPVREDIAIVIHLPADGTGCELLVADIERGWRDAQKLGQLQGSLKVKNRFRSLTQADLGTHQSLPVQVTSPDIVDPWTAPHMAAARDVFLLAEGKNRIAELYQFAMDSGKFSDYELSLLQSVGTKRLRDLNLV